MSPSRSVASAAFSKNQFIKLTGSLIALIMEILEFGDDLRVCGFGKCCVQDKKKRKGRDPAIGEEVMLKSRRATILTVS